MSPDGKVLDNGKPIVAVDIDGTLADYHRYFLSFAEGYLGRTMPDPEEMNPGLPLHEFMGLDKEEYRKVKLAYRQGGLKRTMPAFPGAARLTHQIEMAGAEVWICTTRPYLRLDNIDPDTREWLERNGIKYTCLTFGEDKYEALVDYVGKERIVAVIEDLPEQVDRAKALGLKVYTPDRPYNKTVQWRYSSLDDITQEVLMDLGQYNPSKEIEIVNSPVDGDLSNNRTFQAQQNRPLVPLGDTAYPWFNKTLSLTEADNQYERDREKRWLTLADEALELFIRKSRDYGKTGDSLGARGQFADMWRKFGKIRHQVWDHPEKPVHFEGVEEILKDLIGHSILFLDYVKAGHK